MVAKEEIQIDPLVQKLLADLDATKTSIAAFAKRMGIPSPRVYKWKDEGNRPKTEDAGKINEWLSLNPKTRLLEKVPHETISQQSDNKGENESEGEEIFLNGRIKLTAQEYVDALKADKAKLEEDKRQLQDVLNLNLEAMQQLLSSLSRHDRAYHETILLSLARIERLPKESDLIVAADTREAEKLLQEQNKRNEAKGNFRKK